MTGIATMTKTARPFLAIDLATGLFAVLFGAGIVSLANGQFAPAEQANWLDLVQLAWVILVAYLFFFKREQDEFFQFCWRKAASTTVKAMIIFPAIGIPGTAFLQGLVDGFTGADKSQSDLIANIGFEQSLVMLWTLLFSVFFVSFQINRLRGMR